jgi:hypothetical protein
MYLYFFVQVQPASSERMNAPVQYTARRRTGIIGPTVSPHSLSWIIPGRASSVGFSPRICGSGVRPETQNSQSLCVD